MTTSSPSPAVLDLRRMKEQQAGISFEDWRKVVALLMGWGWYTYQGVAIRNYIVIKPWEEFPVAEFIRCRKLIWRGDARSRAIVRHHRGMHRRRTL